MSYADEAAKNWQALQKNEYPGRGIVLGITNARSLKTEISWLMGRSENSRNRDYIREEKGLVRTAYADPSKGGDPSLVIYNAMREGAYGNFVVSNGDQTDDAVVVRGVNDFYTAMRKREYEPDDPNFTPRITGIMTCSAGDPMAVIAIHRKAPHGTACIRSFYEYPDIAKGFGYCVHTYQGNAPEGKPLPSFEGDPYLLPIIGISAEEIADSYWPRLNAENRVALVVKTIDSVGEIEIAIRNASKI